MIMILKTIKILILKNKNCKIKVESNKGINIMIYFKKIIDFFA